MITPSLENYLNNFGQKVVNDAKKRLQSAKGSTDLGKSIRFKVVPTATGFETKFYMDSYGSYLDKGVSGNKVKQSYTNTKGATVPSPGKGYTTKHPPTGILEKWIKKKGIKGRDMGSTYINSKGKKVKRPATGRFITHKSLAFAIAKSIQKKGIKSLSFFQKPFGVEYDKLKKDILDILKLDIQNYITTFTK